VILPERILFVGAHCDDIELVGGGLLARACFSGRARVGTLVFSDYRGARAEMRDNLAWLTAESGTSIVDHTDVLLPACQGDFQTRRALIYRALEQLRDDYDLVVAHHAGDTNQDHRQVAEEATRVFKAHATLWGGEFPNNDVGDFTPAIYVTLGEREIEAKARMIAGYVSQDLGGRPYLDPSLTRALARLRGAQIRTPWAEAFSVAARVIVR
jgi:LmbE family N-acetylglucosaminyl deacetylase